MADYKRQKSKPAEAPRYNTSRTNYKKETDNDKGPNVVRNQSMENGSRDNHNCHSDMQKHDVLPSHVFRSVERKAEYWHGKDGNDKENFINELIPYDTNFLQ